MVTAVKLLQAGALALFPVGTAIAEAPANSCTQFDGAAELVTFFIDMSLEEREVQVRMPKIFLENARDHQSGTRRGSQIFRVMIEDFSPVAATQAQISSLNIGTTRNTSDMVRVLIGDWASLSDLLADMIPHKQQDSPKSTPAEPNVAPHDWGLSKLITKGDPKQSDIFLARAGEGSIRTLIECFGASPGQPTGCSQYFRSNDLDVILDYAVTNLSDWDALQDRVDQFLECATKEK